MNPTSLQAAPAPPVQPMWAAPAIPAGIPGLIAPHPPPPPHSLWYPPAQCPQRNPHTAPVTPPPPLLLPAPPVCSPRASWAQHLCRVHGGAASGPPHTHTPRVHGSTDPLHLFPRLPPRHGARSGQRVKCSFSKTAPVPAGSEISNSFLAVLSRQRLLAPSRRASPLARGDAVRCGAVRFPGSLQQQLSAGSREGTWGGAPRVVFTPWVLPLTCPRRPHMTPPRTLSPLGLPWPFSLALT